MNDESAEPGKFFEGRPSGPITLEGLVERVDFPTKIFKDVDFTLSLDESLSIILEWEDDFQSTDDLFPTGDANVFFHGSKTPAEFFIIDHRTAFNEKHPTGRHFYRTVPAKQPISIEGDDAVTVAGAIVNGPNLWLTGGPPLTFTNKNYETVVHAYPHTAGLFKQRAHAHTPPKITHHFAFSSKDGTTITPEKAWEDIGRVVAFLSFVKGTRVAMGHFQGSTSLGSPAYRSIGFNKADRFHAGSNWFHFSLTKELPALFESYTGKLAIGTAKRTLGRALQYYKAGNFTQPDATEVALIISAAGLETMAHHVLTTDGGWTADLFKRATLEDKLRAGAAFLGITADPAEHSAALTARLKGMTGKGAKASDGFALLAEFRNGLTHPGEFRYTPDEFMDAWFSSQWLLEVMILAFFGYRGKYQDRRKRSGFAGALDVLPVR